MRNKTSKNNEAGGQRVIVGLVQHPCSPYPEENLKKAAQGIGEAIQRGAQIVSLQELFRTEYFCQTENRAHFKLAEAIPGPTSEALSSLAKRHKIVLVGSLFEKSGEGYFNTAVLFNTDGQFIGKYRKIHIPNDLKNYYGESFYFSPGDTGTPVFESPYGRIGLQVCYDQWFPEGARALAKAGAQIIFYPTAIGYALPSPLPPRGEGNYNQARRAVEGEASSPPLPRRGGGGDASPCNDELDAWITIQRGHAIANGVFIAATNRVGKEDHIEFWGSSFVVDPMGRVLVKGSPEKEEVVTTECDLSRINEVRKDWPFLKEC
ncbi:MAG: carbon-nitrogen hydrolase [Deltaproteobacteria bacterium]|nr:carbon-nitrogen hydrolase [Deltaproteobacteria bacterium]